MALVASTDGYGQTIGQVHMQGSWSGASGADTPVTVSFQWGYGSFGSNTSTEVSAAASGSYVKSPSVDADRTLRFRAKAKTPASEVFGTSSGDFKSYANLAIFGSGLTPGTPTTTTCPVSGSVTPNTLESFGTVYAEYRIAGTVLWTQHNPAILTNISGSSSNAISSTITGLAPGTAYEARFRIDRTTENDTVAYSPIATFTTQSTAATIIAPQTMLGSGQLLTPTLLLGAGGVTIDAPVLGGSNIVQEEANVDSGIGDFLTPRFARSQETIVEIFILINDIIERRVNLG